MAGKASILTKCTFKNITAKTCVLSLYNATIEHCTFSDCTVCDASLLDLVSSNMTSSEFTNCTCKNRDQLIFVRKTNVIRCNFSACYTEASASKVFIIAANEDSAIKNCQFDKCSTKGWYNDSRRIIYLYLSNASDNTFHSCSYWKPYY